MNRGEFHAVLLRLGGLRPINIPADPRLAATRLLTIDAFDTLITRTLFRPIDIFALCGILLRERAIIDIDPAAWRDRRHRVENELAHAASPSEVRLAEIYDRLVLEGSLSADHKAAAYEIEISVERSCSRPIIAMINVANAFAADGRATIVLSDTPLPDTDLAGLLEQAGLSLDRNAVHASSRSGNTKRSGALFRFALSHADRATGNTLHVGDNLHSDYRQARRAGLTAAPYLAGRSSRFERRLFDSLHSSGLLGSILAGSARATRLGRSLGNSHEQAVWDLSSNVTGPLLFSFMTWTLQQARQRGIRTLYFFSRDGEILLQVAQALQHGVAEPIACRYLYVSRQSLHLPGVTELGAPEREWILDNAAQNNLDYLLGRLDIGSREFIDVLPPKSPLRRLYPRVPMTPADIQAMHDALDHEPVQTLILGRAARRRELCLDYMTDQKLLEPGQVGVVDIGWRGRLQRSLCRALSTVDPDYAARLHGFYIDLDRPPTDAGSLSSFSTICGTGFSWTARGSLFEIFCAAQHGTVKRYERTSNGTAVPVLASDANPEAAAWGLAVQQEAVVAFCREVVRNLQLARIEIDKHVPELAQVAVEIVQIFVSRPEASEATVFGAFAHSGDEQHNLVEEMAGPIDFRPHALLKRLGPAYKERRISYWPEGSVARSVPGWLRGAALSMLRAMPGRHG